MNSYSNAYNSSRRDVKARELAVYESQRVDLVNAIKAEYGISDFSTLSEGKKKVVRNLITEMWSPKTGLNKKGEEFMQTRAIPLNESSSPEQVEKEYKKKVKALLNDKFSSSPLFNTSDARNLAEIKEGMEEKIGSKLPAKDCRMWFYEVMCAYVNAHLSSAFAK